MPPIRVWVREVGARARGASVGHLVFWLAMFAAVWASLLFIVPAFDKMFIETGVQLPLTTEVLVVASRFVQSGFGFATAACVVIGSVLVYRRMGGRGISRYAFEMLIAFAFIFFPFAVVMLFQPLIQTTQKL